MTLALVPIQMRAEVDILGFYVPWWLALGAVAYLLAFLAVWILEKSGWLRLIWNPPLFFVALLAFCYSLLGLLLTL